MPRDEYGNETKVNRTNRTTKDTKRQTGAGAFGRRSGYTPVRTGARRGVSTGRVQAFPDPPSYWLGSLPEWAIFWAHGAMGLKRGEDFEYQFYYDQGQVWDFYEYDLDIAIEIQGLFWHYQFGGKERIIQDQERRIRAESAGHTLIFIDEDDAIANPIYFLRLARNGVDRSRVSRGF